MEQSGIPSAPKVSVIIPNYNHSLYLERRFQSIVCQTYSDFELLILDDASKDNSLEIIRDFARHYPARIIENKTNSGSPFRQWNRGVGEARGEYIWIAESDDEADSRFLERMVEVLDSNPNVVLAYCRSTRIDEEGQICKSPVPNWESRSWETDFINPGVKECADHLIWINTIPNASGVLFRKAAYLKAGGAEEGMRFAGDWITWCRILLQGDVAYTAEELNRFRLHGNSVRTTTASSLCSEEYYRVRVLLSQCIEVSPALSGELARTANEAAFWYLKSRDWPKVKELLWAALRHKVQLESFKLVFICFQVFLLTRFPSAYMVAKNILLFPAKCIRKAD